MTNLAGSNGIGGLLDYLGVPPYVDALPISALPVRGYQLIFNEWYRDQDLVGAIPISKASGNDTTTDRFLRNAAWEKDYFTSSRPWTQKGPTVSIPLTGDAPVIGVGVYNNQAFVNSGVAAVGASADGDFPIGTPGISGGAGVFVKGSASGAVSGSNRPDIFADLSNVSAANINDLRLAFALQRYEEARARYGSRYVEYLRYLGVRSSDARLQRPEYLGGGKQTIQFSEVLQTAPNDPEDNVGVGELKGHGISAVRTNRYRRFFEEHGYVLTLMTVRPKTMYPQGLFRTWNRRTKEDFWQRELEHIGQQEVQRKEIYAGAAQPDAMWSYQDRYDEYRRSESTVSGEFRDTLDFWHMARIFESEPTLNASFVSSNPTKRINAVQSQDVLWIMANHSIQARRQLSKRGNSYIY